MTARSSFSVALCTFNGARFLGEQLDSLARQELLPSELVLCDDGSTDGTLGMAEEFAAKSPFPVRLLRNPRNLGYAANFRQALGLCRAELIALCDQDDRWQPNKLRVLAEEFARGGEALGGVFSDGDLMDNQGQPRDGSLWRSFRFGDSAQRRWAGGYAVEELVRRNVVTGMTLALRRKWVPLADSMPSSWHHDAWLALRLADQSRLLPCPKQLVTYRVHEKQQVGVPLGATAKMQYLREHGIGGYLRLSRERNRSDYAKDAAVFEDLLRVTASQNSQVSPRLHHLAEGKTEHARRGEHSLTLGRFQRWPRVLREAQGYPRYSPTGWPAMLRDLLV